MIRSKLNTATVRDVDVTDAKAIAELFCALGYPATAPEVSGRIKKCTSTVDSNVFVAEADGGVVGVASFHRIPLLHADGYLGRVTSLVVASSHQKRGVGRALVAAMEDYGWSHGCTRIEVTSGDHRPEAHAFYERIGYRLNCRRFLKQKPEEPKQPVQTGPTSQPV